MTKHSDSLTSRLEFINIFRHTGCWKLVLLTNAFDENN